MRAAGHAPPRVPPLLRSPFGVPPQQQRERYPCRRFHLIPPRNLSSAWGQAKPTQPRFCAVGQSPTARRKKTVPLSMSAVGLCPTALLPRRAGMALQVRAAGPRTHGPFPSNAIAGTQPPPAPVIFWSAMPYSLLHPPTNTAQGQGGTRATRRARNRHRSGRKPLGQRKSMPRSPFKNTSPKASPYLGGDASIRPARFGRRCGRDAPPILPESTHGFLRRATSARPRWTPGAPRRSTHNAAASQAAGRCFCVWPDASAGAWPARSRCPGRGRSESALHRAPAAAYDPHG